MFPEDEFQTFLERIGPTNPKKNTEALLAHLANMLETLSAAEVDTIRRFVLLSCPPGPGRDTLTEVLEGNLALRRIEQRA